jgi:hypothetical protein
MDYHPPRHSQHTYPHRDAQRERTYASGADRVLADAALVEPRFAVLEKLDIRHEVREDLRFVVALGLACRPDLTAHRYQDSQLSSHPE